MHLEVETAHCDVNLQTSEKSSMTWSSFSKLSAKNVTVVGNCFITAGLTSVIVCMCLQIHKRPQGCRTIVNSSMSLIFVFKLKLSEFQSSCNYSQTAVNGLISDFIPGDFIIAKAILVD